MTSNWEIEDFYDGDCPLCAKEIKMLQSLDRGKGRIRCTDISAASFSAADYGLQHEEMMASIHGRLPDGSLVQGVEVFRQLYSAVGFGPLVALTRLPGISGSLDLGYQLFARNRLRLTGRCESEKACQLQPGGGTAA